MCQNQKEGSGLAFLTVDTESLDAVDRRMKILSGMTLPSK